MQSGGNAQNTQNNNPPPTQSTPTTQLASSTPQIVEYYGDSTIWGWQTGSNNVRVATPAPATFEARIQAVAPQAKYSVKNEGVNGTGACQLRNGLDGHLRWEDQMAASPAAYVIINHGINDVAGNDPNARSTPQQYRQCLTDLAQIAKANKKHVIFETPNPISDNGIANYVAIMKDVASQNGVPVIDQYADLVGLPLDQIVPDGLHPTQEIYTRKGETAARAFLQMSF